MGGSAVFEFKINKVLNLNEFIKLIRKAFKRKINQKDINKSEIFREFLSYHFLVDEGQVSIHLYHKENRLVLFLPPMIFNNLHYTTFLYFLYSTIFPAFISTRSAFRKFTPLDNIL